MAEIRLEGMEELQAALREKVKLDSVKKIVKLNGSELQTNAQREAPYDTGTLRRSIGLEIKDTGKTAKVEAKAEYAPYQEYGTRFMNAHPFMKPAFNAQKGRFKNDLERLAK